MCGGGGVEQQGRQEEALGELHQRPGAESSPVAAPPGGLGGVLLPRAWAARLPSARLWPSPGETTEQMVFKEALSGTGVCIPSLTAASPLLSRPFVRRRSAKESRLVLRSCQPGLPARFPHELELAGSLWLQAHHIPLLWLSWDRSERGSGEKDLSLLMQA